MDGKEMALAADSVVVLADTINKGSPYVHITLNNTCIYNIQYIIL